MKNLTTFLFVLIISSSSLYGFSHTVELSQKELQQRVDKKFPFEKKKLLLTTVVSDPIVTLKKELNHIGISFDIRVIATKKLYFDASAVTSGTLLYKQDEKSFYFKDLKIVELDLKNIPKKFHNAVKSTIKLIVTNYLRYFPVYKIKDKNLKLKLASALLKNIKIENNTIFIELGY